MARSLVREWSESQRYARRLSIINFHYGLRRSEKLMGKPSLSKGRSMFKQVWLFSTSWLHRAWVEVFPFFVLVADACNNEKPFGTCYNPEILALGLIKNLLDETINILRERIKTTAAEMRPILGFSQVRRTLWEESLAIDSDSIVWRSIAKLAGWWRREGKK